MRPLSERLREFPGSTRNKAARHRNPMGTIWRHHWREDASGNTLAGEPPTSPNSELDNNQLAVSRWLDNARPPVTSRSGKATRR